MKKWMLYQAIIYLVWLVVFWFLVPLVFDDNFTLWARFDILQYNILQYNTILYNTTQCNSILYDAIQYNTTQ